MSAGPTLGVEEEYQLVDAATLGLADRGGVVRSAVRLLGERAQGEISTSQLETGTPVVRTLGDLRRELLAVRRGAEQAAQEHGAHVLAAATHPTGSWRDQRLSPAVRYLSLVERWGLIALQQTITGCHVHVGVGDPETAVRLLGHLRPDLPALLAMTGSSPYWEGTDSGYASYRTLWYGRFQVTGAPEPFASKDEYDATVAELVAAGIVDDASHLYWDARPSTKYPTVEVRVADTMPLVDDVVAHAGLARAAVQRAAAEAQREAPVPVLRSEVLRAARWRAARHGLEGPLLSLADRAQRPAAEVLRALRDRLRPELEDNGDWDEVHALVEALLARGTSARRQRAVLERTGDLDAVVRALLEETVRG